MVTNTKCNELLLDASRASEKTMPARKRPQDKHAPLARSQSLSLNHTPDGYKPNNLRCGYNPNNLGILQKSRAPRHKPPSHAPPKDSPPRQAPRGRLPRPYAGGMTPSDMNPTACALKDLLAGKEELFLGSTVTRGSRQLYAFMLSISSWHTNTCIQVESA